MDKENDIVCLFNGEIYNYKEFELRIRWCCLLDVYKKYGDNFVKTTVSLPALFDFKKEIFIISTDVLLQNRYGAFDEDTQKMGISTYKSD